MGIRLPIKLLWTMLVVLLFLALTFLILATDFKVVNLLLNPPLDEPAKEASPQGTPRHWPKGTSRTLLVGHPVRAYTFWISMKEKARG